MRLTAHDASFLYTETASGPMHAVSITLLDGAASFAEVFDFFAQRIHLIPRFRQKLAFVPFNLAHPKWVDDPDFDLRNHLKQHQMPPNTSLARAIETALELGEPLLDRSKPLWLTYVIENAEGKTILAQMSHHAFVDGATAVAMSIALSTPAPDTAPPEPAAPWQPAQVPTAFELWQEAAADNGRQALDDARLTIENATKTAQLNQRANSLMTRMTQPVMQAPWNASLVGPKRRLVTLDYKLQEFKPIRQALGGTINDIVISVVTEGVARYLEAKGEQVQGQSLRLMCPVNVRDPDEDPLGLSGNRVSAMFPVVAAASMPIDERFAQIKEQLNEIKANQEPEIMDQLQHLQPNVPPVAMAQTQNIGSAWDPTIAAAQAPSPIVPHAGGPRPQQAGFNFTCTNVPGPREPQFLAGYPVNKAIGTLMLSGNLGLGVSVVSFEDKFTFCFTVDPRLLPDVDKLAAEVAKALRELREYAEPQEAEADKPKKSKKSKKSKKRKKDKKHKRVD